MPARQIQTVAPDGDVWTGLAQTVLAMAPRDRIVFCSQLDPDDLALVEYALAMLTGKGWRTDPAVFAAMVDQRYQDLAHLRILAGKFRDAVEGRSKRQVWNLPSRYRKTTLLRYGVGWALENNPTARWMYLTYGDTLAGEFGVGVRDLLRSRPDILSTRIRRDVARRDRFMTDQGGGLLCRSFFGSIIGFGVGEGGGLLIDDPMKNWQEAHSQARRDAVWDNFTGTVRHRLDDEDAPIIVCHARWHPDDFTGRLIEHMEDETGEAWELVVIPSLCTDPATDLLGRELGAPIAPEMFTADQVASRHRGMVSTFVVAAIEQQDPQADEGTDLRREWFQIALASEIPTVANRAITSWDLKLKDKEAGDYVVGQCWWQVGTGYWCMDQIRGQYDHATTANAIALLAVRHPEAQRHVIEAAGSYDEVVPELRKPILDYEVSDDMAERLGMSDTERETVQIMRQSGLGNLVGETPEGPKPVRARTYIAPQAEYGHVHVPEDAPWLAAWLDEMAAFPKGAHDDQVDAASQALKELATAPGSISVAKRRSRTQGGGGRTSRSLSRPQPT